SLGNSIGEPARRIGITDDLDVGNPVAHQLARQDVAGSLRSYPEDFCHVLYALLARRVVVVLQYHRATFCATYEHGRSQHYSELVDDTENAVARYFGHLS